MQEFKLLDHGFIKVVDIVGDDKRIVDAARVSYSKGITKRSGDEKLLNYLVKHRHETPLEMVDFTFHVCCPIFVARQWFRHRMSSFNETSLRYSEAEYWFHRPTEWRLQDTKNKQGSKGVIEDQNEIEECNAALDLVIDTCQRQYEDLLSRGVAREQARIVLPMGLYTTFYWKVNGRSLSNFISLRDAENAQPEIQVYAKVLRSIFREACPITVAALEQHVWRKLDE